MPTPYEILLTALNAAETGQRGPDGHLTRDAQRVLVGMMDQLEKPKNSRFPSILLGLVGDEWHGPTPPGEGWVETGKGVRGGKIWRKQGGGGVGPQGGTSPQGQIDPKVAEIQSSLEEQANDAEHAINRFSDEMGPLDLPGVPLINSILPTDDMTAEDHEEIAGFHDAAAELLALQGQNDIAAANKKAAEYHRQIAKKKNRQESLSGLEAPPEAGTNPSGTAPSGTPVPAQPQPQRSYPETDPVKQALQTSPVVRQRSLPSDEQGRNRAFIVELQDGSTGVYKPHDGELAGIRDTVDDRYFTREAAASALADAIGLSDLVPPTSIRTVGSTQGSIQKFVSDARTAAAFLNENDVDIPAAAFGNNPEDVNRAALFDYLTGNSDRHMGNWMVTDAGKIALIDHGTCFPAAPFDSAQYTANSLLKQSSGRIPQEAQSWNWSRIEPVLARFGMTQDEMRFAKLRLGDIRSAQTMDELKALYKERRKHGAPDEDFILESRQ